MATESYLILCDKLIPDLIKPLAHHPLTKGIRQIGPLSNNSADVSEEEDKEDGDLVKGQL